MKSLFFICSILLCMAVVAQSEIRPVPDDYETIQAGIDAAEEGDTVLVQEGEYEENIVFRGLQLVLTSNFIFDPDPSIIEHTTIDGNQEGSCITIFGIENEPTVISGFSVKNGRNTSGGGILCVCSALELSNMLINNNIAIRTGRGGGGIAVIDSSEVTIKNCKINDNTAQEIGGGISVRNSSASIINSEIYRNYASAFGGGLVMLQSKVSIEDTNFLLNEAVDAGGGGIFTADNSELQIRDVVVESNRGDSGGGIYCDLTTGEWHELVIKNNIATYLAGGLYISRSNPVIVNSVISGNISEQDGGIRVYRTAQPTFINSTIVNNNSNSRGGGLDITDTNPVLSNCIVWDNSPTEIYGDGAIVSFSNIRNGYNGEGNISEEPLFVDQHLSDYRLTSESPCIDTGDPDAPLDPDGTRADMGAFYFHQQDIDVEPLLLEFGAVEVGTEDSLSIIVRNTGNTTLIINEFIWSENPHSYFIREEWFDEEIAPNDSRELWVIFAPQADRELNATLTLITVDPDEGEVIVEVRGAMAVGSSFILPPSSFALSAYPNPFNSFTTIEYRVGSDSNPTTLSIYDISGRLVENLVDQHLSPGNYSTVWDASGVGAGVYFVRMEADPPQPPLTKGGVDSRMIRKLVVIK